MQLPATDQEQLPNRARHLPSHRRAKHSTQIGACYTVPKKTKHRTAICGPSPDINTKPPGQFRGVNTCAAPVALHTAHMAARDACADAGGEQAFSSGSVASNQTSSCSREPARMRCSYCCRHCSSPMVRAAVLSLSNTKAAIFKAAQRNPPAAELRWTASGDGLPGGFVLAELSLRDAHG